MKTTLKIGMLAAVAALALAGCNNAIPTEPAADSFAYNADQYYKNVASEAFTVKSIDSTAYGVANASDARLHQVTVTFSHPVTAEAVKQGVNCYKLTNAANKYSMPAQAPATITDVRVDSMGTKAYLTVNTNDIDYLYVKVTASQMRAVNGALLNSDGDDVWGEKDDDDYAKYFGIPRASATPLIGNYDYAKETAKLNKTLLGENVFASLAVKTGSAISEFAYMGKTLELGTSAFVNSFINYLSGYTADVAYTADALNKFANEVLNRYLKLEQYNWETATWENVAVSFATNTAKDMWVSNINVKPNRQLRARLIDADQIQLKDLRSFGYPIRAHLKHNGPKTVVLKEALKTGYLSLQEGDNWPTDTNDEINDLTWKFAADMKTIEITLKSDSLGSDYNVFTGNKWVKVTAANKDAGKASFFAGFDPATVAKDNFKCFSNYDMDGNRKRPLVIKDVIVVQSTVGTNPKAFDKIIISFEDKVRGDTFVYINHKVMTASFAGSYSDGTSKEYTVPKLRFAKTLTSDDPEQLYGWRKIKKDN